MTVLETQMDGVEGVAAGSNDSKRYLTLTGDTVVRGRPQPGHLVPRAHTPEETLRDAAICPCLPWEAILTLCIRMEAEIYDSKTNDRTRDKDPGKDFDTDW